MTWHIDSVAAGQYADRRTDPATAASVETHLMACEQCRALVNGRVGELELSLIWTDIEAVLDAPRLGWIERTMLAVGCSDLTAKTVAATTRARWSYLAVVVVNVLLAIQSSRSSQSDVIFTAFLLLAPLGPVIATAGAFGRWTDPAHVLLSTLPTSTWRMVLVRTAAAVVPALVLTAAATPWLADRGWTAAAWLLPALALSLTTLALSSWIEIEAAAVLVTGAWAGTALALRFHVSDMLDTYVGPVQLVSAVVLAAAATATRTRHSKFDYREF